MKTCGNNLKVCKNARMAFFASLMFKVAGAEILLFAPGLGEELSVPTQLTGVVSMQINEGTANGGKVSFSYPRNIYTGETRLDCGTLSVEELALVGIPSSLGVDGDISVGAGTLHHTGSADKTDRRLVIDTKSDDLPAVVKVEDSLEISGNIDCVSGGFLKSGPGTLVISTPSREGSNSFSRLLKSVRNKRITFPANGDSPTVGIGGVAVTDGRLVIDTADSVTNWFVNPDGGSTYHFIGCATTESGIETAGHLDIRGGYNIFGGKSSSSMWSGSIYVGYNNGDSVTAPEGLMSSLNVSGGVLEARTVVVGGSEVNGANYTGTPSVQLNGGVVDINQLYLAHNHGYASLLVSGGSMSVSSLLVGNNTSATAWDKAPEAEITISGTGVLSFGNNKSLSYMPSNGKMAVTRIRVVDGGTFKFRGTVVRNPEESRSSFLLDGGNVVVLTGEAVEIDSGMPLILGASGGTFDFIYEDSDFSFRSDISPAEGVSDGGLLLKGASGVYRFAGKTLFTGPLSVPDGASVEFANDLSSSLLTMGIGAVGAASSTVAIPSLAHSSVFGRFSYSVENGGVGRLDIGTWAKPLILTIELSGGSVGSTYTLFTCPASCGVTEDMLRLSAGDGIAPDWSVTTEGDRTSVSVTLVPGVPDVAATDWTSSDGVVTVSADDIASGSDTLGVVGNPVKVSVPSGNAVMDQATMVYGSLSVDVDGSIAFPMLKGNVGSLTKKGKGTLSVAGDFSASELTFSEGALTLGKGAFVSRGTGEVLLNDAAHTVHLTDGAILRCGRPRATTEANGANATFHIDGGILQPTDNSYIFAYIKNVMVGEGGLVIDTSYAPAGTIHQYGNLKIADGVLIDGGVRVRGIDKRTVLLFRNEYRLDLKGGLTIESGASVAIRNQNPSTVFDITDVKVLSGGRLVVQGEGSRVAKVKSLTFGVLDADGSELMFSNSAKAVVAVSDAFSVHGKVSVRFPDAVAKGVYSFLKAPKGSLDAGKFELDASHVGLYAVFSVDASNEEYDVLTATVDSSAPKNGVILKNAADEVISGEFSNSGYFVKAGAGTACITHSDSIRVSKDAGSTGNYHKQTEALEIPDVGDIPSVDPLLGVNVIAGSLMLNVEGIVEHSGRTLVGGNKIYLDEKGEPIPAVLDLVNGTLKGGFIVGDVHGYRSEYPSETPKNIFNVWGGTVTVNDTFLLGTYNSAYNNATNEFHLHGGEVTALLPNKSFLVGRRRTDSSESYPDVGQSYANFAVHGGRFARIGTVAISFKGGDAEMKVDGGECTVEGFVTVGADSSAAETKSAIDISGGSLAASNIVINPSFKGTATMSWNGGRFAPIVDAETLNAEFCGPWAENCVGEGGAIFDLSRMSEGAVYRMRIPLAKSASLVGNRQDGGVRIVAGSATLALSAANTYTGPTIIDAGTLKAEIEGSVPQGTVMMVNGEGVFDGNGLEHTVAKVSGNGGRCINGTVCVTGEVSSDSTVTFDRLKLADGATLRFPLVQEDGVYSVNSISVGGGISAEGVLTLGFAGEVSGDVLPKGFAVKIATLAQGAGNFPAVEFDAGLTPQRNCSFGIEMRRGEDGAMEVWAVVRPRGTVIVLR